MQHHSIGCCSLLYLFYGPDQIFLIPSLVNFYEVVCSTFVELYCLLKNGQNPIIRALVINRNNGTSSDIIITNCILLRLMYLCKYTYLYNIYIVQQQILVLLYYTTLYKTLCVQIRKQVRAVICHFRSSLYIHICDRQTKNCPI